MRTVVMGILAVAATATPVAGRQLTIERVAPQDSILVAAVPEAGPAVGRFRQTGLWSLWQQQAARLPRMHAIGEGRAGFAWRSEQWGHDHDTLPRPEGEVGVAVFPGSLYADYILIADFGTAADRAAQLYELIIAHVEQDRNVERRVEQLRGRTLTSVVSPVDILEDFGLMGIEEMVPVMPLLGAGRIAKQGWLGMVRDGSRFIFASDSESLASVLEILDGGEPTGFAQREDFVAVRRQIGPADGWAVMNLPKLMESILNEMDIGLAMMLTGAMWTLAFDVEAIGVGVQVATPSAMVQKKVVIHMPRGRTALAALVDRDAPRGQVPAFVGRDDLGYATVGLRLAELPALLRRLAGETPDIWDFVERFLERYGEEVAEACAALGPRVHLVMSPTNADGPSSLRSLVAIESARPRQVEAVLARHLSAFDLKRRDAGKRHVYTRADDGFSIGFGAGHVLLGHRPVVKEALRVEARGVVPGAIPPSWASAMGELSGDSAAAWGVQTRVDVLDHFSEFNRVVNGRAVFGIFGVLAGGLDALGQGGDLRGHPDPLDALDPGLVAQYVGPMAWQLNSTDTGFVATSALLPAPRTTAEAASDD